jgi:hypothetical protein
MTTRIDNHKLDEMSIDQIGAALQAIASELSIRGNGPDNLGTPKRTYLWAFERIEETARALRRLPQVAQKHAIDLEHCEHCKRAALGSQSCCPFHFVGSKTNA